MRQTSLCGIPKYRVLTLFVALFTPLALLAQGATSRAYWSYIDRYRDMAIEQMHKHRIPASITMAQGLLESNAGRSTLATQAHNHFGIKTPGGWTGPYVVRDDDRRGEHFRKYRNDRESYEDHSLFLKRKRYESLFRLSIYDYKGWARGLKACGYATNPAYAENLIRLIELYNLHQLDRTRSPQLAREKSTDPEVSEFFKHHMVFHNNGNYFIVVAVGDDLATIARETGVSVKKLMKYNDLTYSYRIQAGDLIYMKAKKSRGAKEYRGVPHTVVEGQSLYDISQLYGVKLKSLYQLNALPADYQTKVGDLIWVR